MPAKPRMITRKGVSIEKVQYQSDRLKKYVGVDNEDTPDGRYNFRRNPHDVTKIYFFNPDKEFYETIETANKGFPDQMSKWELEASSPGFRSGCTGRIFVRSFGGLPRFSIFLFSFGGLIPRK